MLVAHLSPLASSLFSLLAIVSLLLAFVMLGSRWLKNYLYAFAAESWAIAALSAAVGYYGNYPELYLIAIFTLSFRGLLLPYLVWRVIRRLAVDREIQLILQPSTSLVIGAFFVMFSLSVAYRVAMVFDLESTIVVLALTVMLSIKLIGFLMLAVRHEAISQVLGLLVLENGIFLGSQILVPGMPLLFELVILFDLLIIVACFGVLVGYLRDACRLDQQPRPQAAGRMMIATLLLVLSIAPAAAAVLCLAIRAPRICEAVNLLAGIAVLASALPLPFLVGDGARHFWNDYVIVDRAGAWVILCTAIGILSRFDLCDRLHAAPGRGCPSPPVLRAVRRLRPDDADRAADEQHRHLLDRDRADHAWSAPFSSLSSDAAESMEAAWKYIMVVSAGISLALLGTILFYWGGSFVLGPSYQLTWSVLAGAAPRMNPVLMTLAFLLVLVGYGTKVGLAPMHTWLPDAHSEAPAPVSAMLSGALAEHCDDRDRALSRHYAGWPVSASCRDWHWCCSGTSSLLIGALFIVRQQGIKRLMAYSSVEHMGVVALGFGFGGPLGIAGALYHMLNHSLNKSLMFFGAGNVMRAYGTKEIAADPRRRATLSE